MPQFGTVGAPPVSGGNSGGISQIQAPQMYQYPNGQIVYAQPAPSQTPQSQIQFPPGNQQQAQPTRIPVSGRFVESLEEVAPNEVSMDGSVSLFPTRDCSRIYARAWTSNGTLQTVEYLPSVPADNSRTPDGIPSSSNDISNEILSRLEAIEKKLDKKPYYGKKPYKPKPQVKEEHNDA